MFPLNHYQQYQQCNYNRGNGRKRGNHNRQHNYGWRWSRRIVAPLMPPSLSVYNFEPLTNIGSGAFAQVYKGVGFITSNTQPVSVALKRVNLDQIEDPAIYQSILKEVNVFQSLNHENIVKCHYSFNELSPVSGHNYLVLVLEYVDGGDLEKWIQGRTIHYTLVPEHEIWSIFSQIASAVAYIHAKRIIHRDLKPPNVLLTMDCRVKLTDFGLSRVQDTRSRAQTVCGTPYYMSPERILEAPYSTKSDVWSLGCILYEMAALSSPFSGEKEDANKLIQKIQDATFPPLPDDCYSVQLEKLINVCLNPKAHQRPDAIEVFRIAQKMAEVSWTMFYKSGGYGHPVCL